jgi:epoxyqueuosine reductase
LLKQSIGRAFDTPLITQCMQQSAHECGLACTQVTAQIDQYSRYNHFSQTHSKSGSFRLIGQGYGELVADGGMLLKFNSVIIRFMHNKAPQKIAVDYTKLTANVKQWGLELGFQAVGISDTDLGAAEARFQQWLAGGNHGTMDYMAKHGSKRSRPAELVPGTIRVISVRMNYYPSESRDAWEVLQDGERAFVSRYALGRDYHKVLRNRLEELAQKIRMQAEQVNYRVFTDSAPVLEVELAEKARLGWRGKHTLLLTREYGSYFFLGEIYTNMPLVKDAETTSKAEIKNHCGSCTACIDICPTQAIVAPYQLDARRCISYLTIEFKGSIPENLRAMMGNRIYGCDDCQMSCPWNRFAQKSLEPDFAVRHGLDNISLTDLFAWDEATFRQNFAGSAVYRIGHEQWLRNIAVALGNAPGTDEVKRALHLHLQSPSALVREHVLWALKQHQ